MDCQQDSFVRDSPARRGLLLFHSGRTEVRKFAELNPFVTLSAAEYYALRGDSADSVEWLDRAVHNGNERLEWFQRNRLLVNIRNHPRFRQIVDSIAFRRKDRTH